jgi:hypothetical protein
MYMLRVIVAALHRPLTGGPPSTASLLISPEQTVRSGSPGGFLVSGGLVAFQDVSARAAR